MKKITYLLAIILISFFCISCAYAYECESYNGNNVNENSYRIWADTVKSYLHKCDDETIMRVQYLKDDENILVEYYDADYNLLSRKLISVEFPVFGGFYATEDYYFILSGQDNPTESDSVTCFAVTKYDQDWKEIATAELKDCNTTIPFFTGSARFDHSENYLIIRTSHEMYTAVDGLRHQANITMQVDINTMEVTDHLSEVSNVGFGYVTHSFNQFVKIDSDKIVSVDHGDCYPRSVVLIKYPTSVSSGKFVPPYSKRCITIDQFPISGESGDNITGCSVGGFEISSTGYITAINSVNQGAFSKIRNIYICYTDKNSNTPSSKKLTECTAESASTPHLVKIDDNNFMVIWYVGEKVYYCNIDNTGNMVSEIFSFNGYLSDCQPILCSDSVVWYVCDDDSTDFYTIDISDISKFNVVTKKMTHNYCVSDFIDSTCSEFGELIEVCLTCNATRIQKINLKAHVFTNYISDGTATCVNDGKLIAKCDNCDEIDYIPEKGDHSFSTDWTIDVDPTCTNVGSKSNHCKNCDEKINVTPVGKLAHIYNMTKILPTCINNGYNIYNCNCGDIYTETIPAKGHSFNDTVCTDCGYDKTDVCNCNCHKTGLSALIWKILNFFYRLLRLNPTCNCGIAHY